jgi:hypothetical protein
MKLNQFLLLLLFCSLYVDIQGQESGTIVMDEVERMRVRREIVLPDISGYKTLKCDFHIHTVFSDGIVWPTLRVDEAWEDGLDAIAITDHIEGHPKKLPGQKHLAYEIALPVARAKNIILVKGGEISRGMPPGHLNALFVKDIDALDVPKWEDALAEAVRQGGFVIWNHPGWRKQQPEVTRWMPEHTVIWQKGWLHGIEVFNEKEWYPEAIRWALEKDLVIVGNSDIHDVYSRKYDTERFPIRPVTLVFAKERTEESLKEALFARQTAALFFNKLVGSKEWVEPLVKQCLLVSTPFLYEDGFIYFEVKNTSDIEFTLIKAGKDESGLPERIILPRQSIVIARVKQEAGESRTYSFLLENVLTGVEQHPEFSFTIK